MIGKVKDPTLDIKAFYQGSIVQWAKSGNEISYGVFLGNKDKYIDIAHIDSGFKEEISLMPSHGSVKLILRSNISGFNDSMNYFRKVVSDFYSQGMKKGGLKGAILGSHYFRLHNIPKLLKTDGWTPIDAINQESKPSTGIFVVKPNYQFGEIDTLASIKCNPNLKEKTLENILNDIIHDRKFEDFGNILFESIPHYNTDNGYLKSFNTYEVPEEFLQFVTNPKNLSDIM